MTRRFFIERVRREIYGSQPTDDAQISVNLVNAYIGEAIAFAAQKNYLDNYKLEGVAFLNNAFYSTFKNLSVVKDYEGVFTIALPSKPVGLGGGEDLDSLQFVDSKGVVSDNAIVVSIREYAYHKKLRQPQNKIIATYDGTNVTVSSTVPLWNYKARIKMVSGGNGNDLDSEMNIPDAYLPTVNEYVLRQLTTMRIQKQDVNNDSIDTP